MNILPINKIILASFAFALTHWKKIVEISILPVAISLPLLLILPQMFELMDVVFQGGELTEVVLPDNTPVYLLLFFYGYIMLSVNMYRLVVLGEQAVSAMSPFLIFAKFLGLLV